MSKASGIKMKDDEWYESLIRLRISDPEQLDLDYVKELEIELPEERGWIWYAYHYIITYPESKNPDEARSYLISLRNQKSTDNSLESDEFPDEDSDLELPELFANKVYSNKNRNYNGYNSIPNDAKQPIDNSDFYVKSYALEIYKEINTLFDDTQSIEFDDLREKIYEYASMEEWRILITLEILRIVEPIGDIPVGELITLLCHKLIHLLNNEEYLD